MDIAASIWIQPGTLEQLHSRKIESIKTADEYSLNSLLLSAKKRGWIYQKKETWHCYKKTVLDVLNPYGYDLELPADTRSEFRKAFDRARAKGWG